MKKLSKEQFNSLLEFFESEGIIFVNTGLLGEVDLSKAETEITFLEKKLVEDVLEKSDEGEKLLKWLAENKIRFKTFGKSGVAIHFEKNGEDVALGESMWVWKKGNDVDVTIFSRWVEVEKAVDGINDKR